MKLSQALALSVAVALAPAYGQATQVNVAGSWKISGDASGNGFTTVCTFKQDGQKLTGTCQMSTAPAPRELTGEVQDKKVNWKFNSEYNGEPLTIAFSGTLDDANAKLNGSLDVQPFGVSGSFTAEKDAPKKEQ